MTEINWDKWNKIWEIASNADAETHTFLAAHRFTVPPVEVPNSQHCFCGWVGESHSDHLLEEIHNFQHPVAPVKKAPRKKA